MDSCALWQKIGWDHFHPCWLLRDHACVRGPEKKNRNVGNGGLAAAHLSVQRGFTDEQMSPILHLLTFSSSHV